MSTQKMIREIKRQAAKLDVRITYRHTGKGHMKAVAHFEDGRTHVFTIASSPTDEDVAIERTIHELRKVKDSNA